MGSAGGMFSGIVPPISSIADRTLFPTISWASMASRWFLMPSCLSFSRVWDMRNWLAISSVVPYTLNKVADPYRSNIRCRDRWAFWEIQKRGTEKAKNTRCLVKTRDSWVDVSLALYENERWLETILGSYQLELYESRLKLLITPRCLSKETQLFRLTLRGDQALTSLQLS